MTRLSRLKGFKVSKTPSGKTVLEPIQAYGRSVSDKIRQRKSKKVRVKRGGA